MTRPRSYGQGNRCVDHVVVDYLVKLWAPKPGTHCELKP